MAQMMHEVQTVKPGAATSLYKQKLTYTSAQILHWLSSLSFQRLKDSAIMSFLPLAHAFTHRHTALLKRTLLPPYVKIITSRPRLPKIFQGGTVNCDGDRADSCVHTQEPNNIPI